MTESLKDTTTTHYQCKWLVTLRSYRLKSTFQWEFCFRQNFLWRKSGIFRLRGPWAYAKYKAKDL